MSLVGLIAFINISGLDMIDFGTVPLTSCGTVEPSYLNEMPYDDIYQVPLSYNEVFRGGLPVIVMGEYCVCDPSCEAVCKDTFSWRILM
jgi:hypothetical protein